MIDPQTVDLLKAAGDRYRNNADERKKIMKEIKAKGVVAAEDPARVKARRAILGGVSDAILERVIDVNDLLPVNYLELGMQRSHSVCLIQIRSQSGSSLGKGTGFMVSPNLLMTNNHVLGNKENTTHSLAEFNFEFDLNETRKASKTFALQPARFFFTSPFQDGLDFTLVAVSPTSKDGTTQLSDFGFFRLIEESGKALIGEAVTIIQHPQGAEKQIALRGNKLTGLPDRFAHYETDTMPGSSGSPVFNNQWEVVALHHSGVPKVNADGKILTKDGRIWNKDTMSDEAIDWVANEGIRISNIFEHLRSQNWTPDQKILLQEFGLTFA